MGVPDLRATAVILIESEDSYVTWWCRSCKFGDSYISGLGRVLESVDSHVHDRHRGDRVILNIPQPLMTSRVWHFGSTPKCRCNVSLKSNRAICVKCNGVVV